MKGKTWHRLVLADLTRKRGRATAYICEKYVCNLPTTDPQIAADCWDGSQVNRE